MSSAVVGAGVPGVEELGVESGEEEAEDESPSKLEA